MYTRVHACMLCKYNLSLDTCMGSTWGKCLRGGRLWAIVYRPTMHLLSLPIVSGNCIVVKPQAEGQGLRMRTSI